ncbi:sugar ABC transporter substrate-binding protein [Nakamurella multipartita]|jgi:D-xylose transport system substrate-binding protein|uniref:Periplasmic binding protein/LacI transcriptional regulator n=1 Tax=Nakamurella multipartita (strain ATCC 700099 / DSM 44233 / CIP 104796 / JCM 9543 / NBRC 105858 / Y-104) TaxID=479431 RepID=C8XDC2_NAKMY|nr:substrate-binding domain-containing protein [Nakamurella multipartita]ACV81612.1 periplasmic binding protein/LacI transcriptional regulator [Nakamurella multipartita DSM 44233]
MRLKSPVMVGMVAAGALLLAACGSSSSSSGTTSAAASGSGTSAAASGSAAGGATGKVGVILPDTKSSARWETQDRPALEKAFQAAGVEFDIQNANGDKAAMATIADQMIANGATVLAIVNLDNESGAAIEKKAASQGVQTIDYDRLTLGGGADYYVSFDNTEVGKLQGTGLAKCLGSGDKKIVYLNGSPSDSNATAFSAGAHSVLDPMTNYTVVAEQAVPDWDNQQAGVIYEQMYTAQGGKIDGVLAANDGLGNAAIAINKKNGLQIPVTGQDATVQGLQNILAGDQCMTVFKDTNKEAAALAKVAIALAQGQTPQTTGTVKDTTGNRDVAAILETPEAIYKENVKDVVTAGGTTAAELCTGAYAAACTELGIS